MSRVRTNRVAEFTEGAGVTIDDPRFASGPWVDVTSSDYAADSTGATDSADVIDAAAADLSADGGGTLFLPPGTFTYESDALALPSNVVLQGSGMGRSILSMPTNGAAANRRVLVEDKSNVTIRDLTIQETGASRTGVYGCLHIVGSSNVRVDRVETTAGSSVGIMVSEGSQYFAIRGCYVHSNKADGIHIQRGALDGIVANNVLRNNGDDDIACISHDFTGFGHVRNIAIIGNRLGDQNASLNLGNGISIGGATGIAVVGNVIRNPRFAGIRCTSYDGGAEGHGMAGRVLIEANEIFGAGQSGSGAGRDGIVIGNVRGVSIRGNMIWGSTLSGINATGALVDIAIDGNEIENSAGGRGIYVEPTEVSTAPHLLLWTDTEWSDSESLAYVFGHRISITRNRVGKTSIDGIYVLGTSGRSVAGLTVSGNDVSKTNSSNTGSIRGIYVQYATEAVIEHNNVRASWNGNSITKVATANVTHLRTSQRDTLDGWYQDNITASQTNVALSRLGATAYPTALIAVRAGAVTGLCVQLTAGAAGANLTAEVAIDGVLTGVQVVLTSAGADTFKTVTLEPTASAAQAFTAGQKIEVLITTPVGWTGTTTDLRATVEIET